MFGEVRRGGLRPPTCPHASTWLRGTVTELAEPVEAKLEFVPGTRMTERKDQMGPPINRTSSRLPRRFPVGATYVVEGFGGEEGRLRVIARYVVLPGGRRINVPADLPSPPPPRALPFRRQSNTKQSQPRAGSGKKLALRRGHHSAGH